VTRVMAGSGPVSSAQAAQAAPPGQAVQPVPPVQALQAALAAEDAAIFGYGVAGAHLSGARKSAAEQDWTGHNKARDTLTALISALGAAPVAAQAYYQLPFAVHDAASAAKLAAYIEDGVTRAYLGLVAVSDRRLRTFGALAMQSSAERAAFWRGTTEAFPGLYPS
jgi:NAD(P)H-dependent FMN reductase